MNESGGHPSLPEIMAGTQAAGSAIVAPDVTPLTAPLHPAPVSAPGQSIKSPAKPPGRKNHTLHKDSLYMHRRGECFYLISEDYSYKTGSYYTVLRMEMEGKQVLPSTGTMIDAFVVPISLERADLAGIPVCAWEISQGYVPLPAILYGINYFATTSEFIIASDSEAAKEAVKHITNKGKYPFCYQKLDEGADICQCTAIFGKTVGQKDAVAELAEKVYALFSIPLMQLVMVRNGDRYALSSISSTRYSHLTEADRSLLEAHLCHQEFL